MVRGRSGIQAVGDGGEVFEDEAARGDAQVEFGLDLSDGAHGEQGMAPEFEEVVTGEAEVREVFRVPRIGAIAGCYVRSGVISRGSKVRFLRDGTIIWKGSIQSLRRFKDDAREVREGFECGVGLSDFQDLKPGDLVFYFGGSVHHVGMYIGNVAGCRKLELYAGSVDLAGTGQTDNTTFKTPYIPVAEKDLGKKNNLVAEGGTFPQINQF